MLDQTPVRAHAPRRRTARLRSGALLTAVALLLVGGTDAVTYAATGDSLVVGRLNDADRPTRLSSSGAGPALRLRTSDPATAPLAVSNATKVRRLNADRVDGLTSGELEPSQRAYGWVPDAQPEPAAEFAWSVPAPDGVHEVFFEVIASGPGATDAQCLVFGGGLPVVGADFDLPDADGDPVSAISGSGLAASAGGMQLVCLDRAGAEFLPQQVAVVLKRARTGRFTDDLTLLEDSIFTPRRLLRGSPALR